MLLFGKPCWNENHSERMAYVGYWSGIPNDWRILTWSCDIQQELESGSTNYLCIWCVNESYFQNGQDWNYNSKKIVT